jgi:hypothetical protein
MTEAVAWKVTKEPEGRVAFTLRKRKEGKKHDKLERSVTRREPKGGRRLFLPYRACFLKTSAGRFGVLFC